MSPSGYKLWPKPVFGLRAKIWGETPSLGAEPLSQRQALFPRGGGNLNPIWRQAGAMVPKTVQDGAKMRPRRAQDGHLAPACRPIVAKTAQDGPKKCPRRAAPWMSRAARAGGVGVNADAVSLFSRFDFLIIFKFNFNLKSDDSPSFGISTRLIWQQSVHSTNP